VAKSEGIALLQCEPRIARIERMIYSRLSRIEHVIVFATKMNVA
jgi:hypothetical protein